MHRPPLALLLSTLVYVVVTSLMGRHVLQSIGSSIAGDPGDPILNASILAWNATHVPWTDAWFQFPIFHPAANTLTFSEHLLGVSLIASPIYWATGNALTTYNLTLLIAFPLSGLAMYALVWHLTRHSGAAFLAGLAFAFAPFRVSHLPQIQVQAVFWAPLALLGLHRFISAGPPSPLDGSRGALSHVERATGPALHERNAAWAGSRDGAFETPRTRRRWLALFAVCWALQGASNGYFLVFFSVLIALWLFWFVVARKRWSDLGWIVFALVVASLPLIPILYRYVTVHRDLGFTRNIGEIASFGADIAGIFCAPPALTFWGWVNVACAPEGELFVGIGLVGVLIWAAVAPSRGVPASKPPDASRRGVTIVRRSAIALALVFAGLAGFTAVFGAWRIDLGLFRASASAPDKPMSTALALILLAFALSSTFHRAVQRGATTSFYFGTALVCWIFAWGPFPRLLGNDALYQAPFAWLMLIPGVDGLRAPARFWMMSIVCLCILLGLLTARALSGRTRLGSLTVMTIATTALLIDGWTTISLAAAPPSVPDPVALRNEVVLHLPVGDLFPDIASGYRAALGQWRSVNGYSGYQPAHYEALRTLSRDRSDALLDPFLERGDVYVVVEERQSDLRAMVERREGAELMARGNGLLQYRLRRRVAPPVDARPRGERVEPRAMTASCGSEGLHFATDRDLTTRWVCGLQVNDHDIAIDLGEARRVGALVMSLGSAGSDFPRELVIETSTDNTGWTVVWRGSLAAAVLKAALESPAETRLDVAFTPRAARFIRLRQVGRDDRFWSIAELSVRSE